MRIYKAIIISFLLFFCSLAPNLVLAEGITITNPLAFDTIEDLIIGLITFLWRIATAVTPLMIVIGGFYFVTSAGNPQQVTTGKKIILYTIIGYAIISISRGLIWVIRDILGG